jgi:hypothetical protein
MGRTGLQGSQGNVGERGPQGNSSNSNKYRASSTSGDIWILEDFGGTMNYSTTNIDGSSKIGSFTYTLFLDGISTVNDPSGTVLGMNLVPQSNILLSVINSQASPDLAVGVAMVNFPISMVMNSQNNFVQRMDSHQFIGTSLTSNGLMEIKSNDIYNDTDNFSLNSTSFNLNNSTISPDHTYLQVPIDGDTLICFGASLGNFIAGQSQQVL